MGLGKPFGLDLNEKPIKENDVDNQPIPIVKLPQAYEYTQLLANFAMEHPLKFPMVHPMNMHSFMDKLNKMSITNINKQQTLLEDQKKFFLS